MRLCRRPIPEAYRIVSPTAAPGYRTAGRIQRRGSLRPRTSRSEVDPMRSTLIALAACAFAFAAEPAAKACDDNTDTTVAKLQKLDLTTNQLKAIFAYQAEHKAFIAKSHKEGLGCLAHEKHQADFEKSAFGVLDDSQFQKFTGRKRTEAESLRYDNYILRQEIERLKAELESLKKDVKKAEPAKEEAPKKDAK